MAAAVSMEVEGEAGTTAVDEREVASAEGGVGGGGHGGGGEGGGGKGGGAVGGGGCRRWR